MSDLPFNVLVGLTLTEVNATVGDTEVFLLSADGRLFRMHNFESDCGNDVDVQLDDICGELSDIIGEPIVQAEMSNNDRQTIHELLETGVVKGKSDDENFTWTFYRITTIKGQVVLRWYGRSNGYYSEEVQLTEIKPRENI